MEIYLIRHTKPDVEEGICYGQTDIGLAETFPQEWTVLKNKIPDTFERVYTSPLERCYQLARLFRTDKLISDPRLLEMNFGHWEMRRWDDISPIELKEWMEDYVMKQAPEGESYQQLFNRVGDFLEELVSLSLNKVVIVTHAGVIRAFVCKILGVSLTKAFDLEFDFGKVSLVHGSQQGLKIKYLNV